MKIYNKLVRDKIPEIIAQDHKKCETRILEDEEYLVSLKQKLLEEVNEYLSSGEVEELADIEEVLLALVKSNDVSYQDFEQIRKKKVLERGAFDHKVFLISTSDDD